MGRSGDSGRGRRQGVEQDVQRRQGFRGEGGDGGYLPVGRVGYVHHRGGGLLRGVVRGADGADEARVRGQGRSRQGARVQAQQPPLPRHPREEVPMIDYDSLFVI